jgi:hypothetical protein
VSKGDIVGFSSQLYSRQCRLRKALRKPPPFTPQALSEPFSRQVLARFPEFFPLLPSLLFSPLSPVSTNDANVCMGLTSRGYCWCFSIGESSACEPRGCRLDCRHDSNAASPPPRPRQDKAPGKKWHTHTHKHTQTHTHTLSLSLALRRESVCVCCERGRLFGGWMDRRIDSLIRRLVCSPPHYTTLYAGPLSRALVLTIRFIVWIEFSLLRSFYLRRMRHVEIYPLPLLLCLSFGSRFTLSQMLLSQLHQS